MIQPLDRDLGKRPVHLRDVPHVVYEFYDSSGQPLYVGCTSDLIRRLEQHRSKRKEMWHSVVSIRTTQYRNRRIGLEVEAELIRELDPPWNSIGTTHYASS